LLAGAAYDIEDNNRHEEQIILNDGDNNYQPTLEAQFEEGPTHVG